MTKTFIDQVIEDGRPVTDLYDAIGEFSLGNGFDYLGNFLGLNDEEYQKIGHLMFNKGTAIAAIELQKIIDKRIEEKIL